MRLAPVLLLLVGCAHRGGLGFPGPMGHMGTTPAAYVDTLDADEDVDESQEAVVQAPAPAPEAAPPPRRRARRGDPTGEQVARTAAGLVGDRRLVVHGDSFRYDCSGLVEAAHAGADIRLQGSSKDLYARAKDEGLLHKRKHPAPGDVAFFDDTYDRNHNRRRDDDLTHVAVVERVAADGTITLVHKGGKGVVRISMNLEHPHDRADDQGRERNDHLRDPSDKDGGPTLSGELFRAFGSLWQVEDGGAATADAR